MLEFEEKFNRVAVLLVEELKEHLRKRRNDNTGNV